MAAPGSGAWRKYPAPKTDPLKPPSAPNCQTDAGEDCCSKSFSSLFGPYVLHGLSRRKTGSGIGAIKAPARTNVKLHFWSMARKIKRLRNIVGPQVRKLRYERGSDAGTFCGSMLRSGPPIEPRHTFQDRGSTSLCERLRVGAFGGSSQGECFGASPSAPRDRSPRIWFALTFSWRRAFFQILSQRFVAFLERQFPQGRDRSIEFFHVPSLRAEQRLKRGHQVVIR